MSIPLLLHSTARQSRAVLEGQHFGVTGQSLIQAVQPIRHELRIVAKLRDKRGCLAGCRIQCLQRNRDRTLDSWFRRGWQEAIEQKKCPDENETGLETDRWLTFSQGRTLHRIHVLQKMQSEAGGLQTSLEQHFSWKIRRDAMPGDKIVGKCTGRVFPETLKSCQKFG